MHCSFYISKHNFTSYPIVVNAQLVDGLPSGYVRFLLDLDGKSTTRRHGFEMEGTLTTKGCNNEAPTRNLICYKTKKKIEKEKIKGIVYISG